MSIKEIETNITIESQRVYVIKYTIEVNQYLIERQF